MNDEDETIITICQGPPRCSLRAEEAVVAQNAGCIWCDRIRILADGTEIKTGPTTQ